MVWLVRRPVIKLPRLAPPADQVKRIHGAVIISALCSCRVSEVRHSFCVAEVNSNNKSVRVYTGINEISRKGPLKAYLFRQLGSFGEDFWIDCV